ncbi:MAG: pentapeptide repeat-containing protein, partial [Candidatus Parcubacteria bacterium]|nr:pentapeptide repeat-containing protein [Leptolyngbyaceae cyanobacterium LF-bin-113]
MKRSLAIAFSLSLTLGAAVMAANPTQVQKLLNSGECVNCDLSEASLYSYVLDGVNLTGANLSGAALQGSKLNSAT